MPPIQLVIFDCDGVLIDSEPLSRALLAEEATSLGWPMQAHEAHRFTGLTWTAIKPVYEAAIGRELPVDWPNSLQARLIDKLNRGVAAMGGAREVLQAVSHLGLAYRIASNSSHEEMAAKFGFTGLASLVGGRMHSARDVAKSKPAPDLFLAAAASAGVAPEACVVVEDSVPGLTAARAANMRVVAFAPQGLPPHLAFAPHHTVASLGELPALLAGMMMDKAA